MGVIDRLRGLSILGPAPDDEGVAEAARDAAELNSTAVAMGEQRGDFMMLPPLGRTFGSMKRIQQPIGTFLVTHRPTAVTNEPLTHGVDDGPLGLITARARRRPGRATSRMQRDPLVHRSRDEAELDEMADDPAAPALPPMPPPRRLAASAKAPAAQIAAEPNRASESSTAPPVHASIATPLLPSRAEVSRAVRAPNVPAAPTRGGAARDVLVGNVLEPWSPAPFTAPEMPASTISNAPDSVPVLRRRASRGRINAPIEPEDPEDALVERALAGMEIDTAEPNAVKAADDQAEGERWSGPTPLAHSRVRGAAPPEPPTRPDSPAVVQRPVEGLAEPSPVDRVAPAPTAPSPPAEPTPAPAEPAQRGTSRTTPTISQVPNDGMSSAAPAASEQRGSAASPLTGSAAVASASGVPITASPGRSTGGRPTLASRPPIVSAGATGIQRRARDDSGGMRTATPPGPRATMPESGQRPLGEGQPGSSGGSRSVAVPEQVQQAVRDSVGTAPSQVVVHEGGRAEALTRSVNAEAFTRDGEIFLAADAPLNSTRGQELLAHELTHVVQQKGGDERMPAEHTAEGLDMEAGARRAEGLLKTMFQAPPQLHHRSGSVNAPAVPQLMASEGVQRSARGTPPPVGSPDPIASAPALSRGGPRPVNFLDENWRVELGQRPEGIATSSMSDSELALSSAPPPITKDERSGRLRDLERQAHELYPLIRQRLRAELVRDKERRGRMSREWG